MPLRTSNGTGGGNYHLGASWAGGIPPAGADTFRVLLGDIITVVTAGGATGNAGGTVDVGGSYIINSTAGHAITGNVAHNGTFGMIGSGNNAVPTYMQLFGCVWTCGTAAIWNVVGTLPWSTPDILVIPNATSQFDGVYRPGITGVIEKTEFRTGGMARLFYRFSSSTPALRWTDIYFNSIAAGNICAGGSLSLISQFYFTGTIYFRNTAAAAIAFIYCAIYGTATILIESSVTSAGAQVGSSFIYDTIHVNINEAAGSNRVAIAYFYANTQLTILDVANDATINNSGFSNSVALNLSTTTANRKMINRSYVCDTDGLINLVNSAAGMTVLTLNSTFNLRNLMVTVVGGTVILNDAFTQVCYWQASRSINFVIIGAAAITLNGAGSVLQYEPILYKYDLTNYLYAIQYDITNGCPNYTALYGASTLWTAATKTLAAGGVLRIYSTGHSPTGMDMAISDLSGFTLATTGTAAYVATYQISFDGGVLWSAAMTLAQLQSNAYTINGNSYTTDPRYNIQIRIILTSAGGGTVTQVRVTGIKYDPVGVGWNIRNTLEDIEGAGFVSASHSLVAISSLISVIKGVAYKILKIVEWIRDWIDNKIVKYQGR